MPQAGKIIRNHKESKTCLCCNKKFFRIKGICSNKQWDKRKYCSHECSVKHFYPERQRILWDKKEYREMMIKNHIGQVPWSKGKKVLQISGDKNYNWKGGITPLYHHIRCSFEYRQWRCDIFTRDNFTCTRCGEKPKILHTHHIKPFHKILKENNIKTYEESILCEELWNINNGMTLCSKCHMFIHSKLSKK